MSLLQTHDNAAAREAITITFAPHTMSCSWIKMGPTKRMHLAAYKKTIFNNLELERLSIFNPTSLVRTIRNFITTYKLFDLPVLCSLIGPSVTEQLVAMPTAHPSLAEFPLSHAPHWQWHYHYLYPHDHTHFFYLCGMRKTLLLQYQLLAIQAGIDLQLITTERHSLLHLYRARFGSAFRTTHLGNDLMHRNNNIEQLFTRDDLARILNIPPHHSLTPHDTIPLLTACGLFVSGECV